MAAKYPETEADFLSLIENIDIELKKRDIPIHSRPVHAFSEVCKRLRISIPFVPDGSPVQGDYSGSSLSAHIHLWYQNKYGDRLKINFSPGSVAILIRGDPWKINFPLFYGRFRLVFGPFLDRDGASPDHDEIYPFRWIEGFTPGLAKSLNRAEIQHIAGFVTFALQAIQKLRAVQNERYIPEARVDLANAVSSLFLSRPNYGQSKWASLQFAEKLFKSFLTLKKVTFPKGRKGHDLAELAKLSEDNGLQGRKPLPVASIQCEPGLRYGETRVDAADAIRAHHASLIVCNMLCPEIKILMPPVSVTPPHK
jgi:hypothetical protein